MGTACWETVDSKQSQYIVEENQLQNFYKTLSRTIETQKTDLGITKYSLNNIARTKQRTLILPVYAQFSPQKLVRFYLFYSCYINKYIKNASQRKKLEEEFYTYVAKNNTTPEEKKEAEQLKNAFQKQKSDPKKDTIILTSLFKNSIVYQNIKKITLNNSTNLDKLIFPITRLFKAIKALQGSNTKKDMIFIVVAVENEEEEELKSIVGKDAYFSFSVFMKGFTSEKHARSKQKQLNKLGKEKALIFSVHFPNKPDKIEAEFDYGYYVMKNADENIKKEGDVVFNIMNTFKVLKDSSPSQKQYQLQYGYLPYLYYAQFVDRNLNIKDPSIIKIFELCNAVATYYLNSQSQLFKIVGGSEKEVNS